MASVRLATLMAASAVGAAGLGASGTAGALLSRAISGSDAVAGLPLGLGVLGSGLGALLVTRLTMRISYPAALSVGYLLGACGAATVVASARGDNLGLLLLGSVFVGIANVAVSLTRYAAAEGAADGRAGRALAWPLFAATGGAVLSPSMLAPSGDLAEALGVPRLSGMYVVATIVFVVAALVLVAPALLPSIKTVSGRAPPRVSLSMRAAAVTSVGGRATRQAIVVLAVTNLLMVAVMAVAPVRLIEGGHSLDHIGVVLSAHVGGMFVPSLLTGWLVDRVRPVMVAASGLALLMLTGVAGLLGLDAHVAWATGLLVLLGVGWNCGVVGGSAMLLNGAPDGVRAHAEGLGELAMGLAAAVGAPLAGVAVAVNGDLAIVWLAVLVVAGFGLAGVMSRH